MQLNKILQFMNFVGSMIIIESSFPRYKRPSVSCDLEEYTSNNHLDMFENVAIWDYPIFELEEKAGNHILSHVKHRREGKGRSLWVWSFCDRMAFYGIFYLRHSHQMRMLIGYYFCLIHAKVGHYIV